MIFGNTKKEGETLKDVIGDRESIVINYTKLNKRIQECKAKKEDKSCREELKSIGVTFLDE